VHDIGKNLVNIMFEGAGFQVIDLGVQVAPEKFVDAVRTHKPDIVGFSAFLTTTMPMFKANINALTKAGLRDQVMVMVGGAPVTQEYADVVGADDLVAQVEGGFLEFDVAIATPDLMGQVGKLGRVLGPRGLMPNPKTGTVTTDVAKAVTEFKGGRVEYRTDKVGNVHVRAGKASFSRQQLLDNIHAVVEELMRAKPAAAKGRYLRTVTLASTMGPGVHIDPAKARAAEEDLAATA
jgi:large subunit ribosomal protein L1